MGFGGGGSSSSQFNQGGTNSASFLDPMQAPYLKTAYQVSQNFTNPRKTQNAAWRSRSRTINQSQGAFNNIAGLTDTSGQIAAQQQSLQAGLGQLFREELNPAISSNAIAAGGFGGGRQGVAQGQAVGQIAQAYTQGLGDITARANQTALGAGSQIPGMASSIWEQNINPTMAGLDPLARFADILGGPTILNRLSSYNVGSSNANDQRFSFGLG